MKYSWKIRETCYYYDENYWIWKNHKGVRSLKTKMTTKSDEFLGVDVIFIVFDRERKSIEALLLLSPTNIGAFHLTSDRSCYIVSKLINNRGECVIFVLFFLILHASTVSSTFSCCHSYKATFSLLIQAIFLWKFFVLYLIIKIVV